MKIRAASILAFASLVSVGLSVAPARADGGASSLPKRVVTASLGSAVGTPIALVRCTAREIVKRTKEAYDLGGMPKPIGYATAGFFGVFSGVFFGIGCGLTDGVADGIVNSGDGPLNKGSLSLDDLYI